MKVVGIVLAVSFYIVVVFSICSYLARVASWLKADRGEAAAHRGAMTATTFAQGIMDIVSFRRLFAVNEGLWFGEVVFHFSFALVALRHLRYVLDPVPSCIEALQPIGSIAGYVLLCTLLYIVVKKTVIEKKSYLPSYNFFLLGLLAVLSGTGLLLKRVFRTDIVAVKEFAMGLVTFSPAEAPDSILFIIHFVVFLVLIASLPSHVFAAPLTLLEARQREQALQGVLHER